MELNNNYSSREKPLNNEQQSILLDEQEQEDVINELFQVALHHRDRAERIMCAMGLFFSFCMVGATIYYSLFVILLPLVLLLLQKVNREEEEEEEDAPKLIACAVGYIFGGLYSAYLHLLAAATHDSFFRLENDKGNYLLTAFPNPIRLVRRMAQKVLLVSEGKNEETYLYFHRHNCYPTQEPLLLDVILVLLSFLSPTIFFLIRRSNTIPTSTITTAMPAIACCNIITAGCGIFIRRDTFSTLSSVRDLKKSKYHYKSL